MSRRRRATLPTLVRGIAATTVLVTAAALGSPVASADHTGGEAGPVHAGNTYGWWAQGIGWREEFETPTMGRQWRAAGPGQVQHQNGMLTLNTTTEGSVSATLRRRGRATGRWETRLRSRGYGRGGKNFRVVTELIPAGKRDQHCGAQNIALEKHRIRSSKAKFYIHNLPDHAFRASVSDLDLGRDKWHTYAVEVTPERISWFVDAHVVRSERRPEAYSGVPLTVRFTMEAVAGRVMNRSRMQMDWLRYWTLEAPNTQSVDAPETRMGRYGRAC